jgi:hypothetical protein
MLSMHYVHELVNKLGEDKVTCRLTIKEAKKQKRVKQMSL